MLGTELQKEEKIYRDVSKVNGVGGEACKQTIINEEVMALLEVCTKGVWEREHLGKCQEKVALWWSLAGDKLGENAPAQGDTMQTQHDQMTRDVWSTMKCVLDIFLGGGKGEKNT